MIVNHLHNLRMVEYGCWRRNCTAICGLYWCARCVVILPSIHGAIDRVRPWRYRNIRKCAHGGTITRNCGLRDPKFQGLVLCAISDVVVAPWLGKHMADTQWRHKTWGEGIECGETNGKQDAQMKSNTIVEKRDVSLDRTKLRWSIEIDETEMQDCVTRQNWRNRKAMA